MYNEPSRGGDWLSLQDLSLQTEQFWIIQHFSLMPNLILKKTTFRLNQATAATRCPSGTDTGAGLQTQGTTGCEITTWACSFIHIPELSKKKKSRTFSSRMNRYYLSESHNSISKSSETMTSSSLSNWICTAAITLSSNVVCIQNLN